MSSRAIQVPNAKIYNRGLTCLSLKNGGYVFNFGTVTTPVPVRAYEFNEDGDIMYCSGNVDPTSSLNNVAGFGKEATFIKKNAADGTHGLYQNIGTNLDTNWELVSSVTPSSLSLTHNYIYVGQADDTAGAVAQTGDGSFSDTGVFAIGTGVIVNADVNASAAIAYSKLALTNSIVAGDVTAGAITNPKVADTTGAGGLAIKKIAIVKYDFAVDGGAQGTIALTGSPTIPDKAVVWVESYRVLTTCTSSSDAATIALQLPTDGALTTAIAISDGSNPWDAGVFSRIAGGLATPLTKLTTAARVPSLLVAGGEDLTAGVIEFQLSYWVSA